MTTPPKPGARPSVRVGQDLSDDFAVIMSVSDSTTTVSDIVRDCVRHVADAYRRAWDYGDVPEGTAPTILGVYYAEAPARAPVRHTPAPLSDTAQAPSDSGPRPAHRAPAAPATARPRPAVPDGSPAPSDTPRPTGGAPVRHQRPAAGRTG